MEELIKELDSREAAEVPKVVRLNYANPETLAERLNAMFNEAGTSATIRLTEHGLSEYSMDEGSTGTNGSNNASRTPPATAAAKPSGGEYRPWWTTGRRRHRRDADQQHHRPGAVHPRDATAGPSWCSRRRSSWTASRR